VPSFHTKGDSFDWPNRPAEGDGKTLERPTFTRWEERGQLYSLKLSPVKINIENTKKNKNRPMLWGDCGCRWRAAKREEGTCDAPNRKITKSLLEG